MASSPQFSFSGGEWTPYLEERVDLAKYAVACRTLENMVLTTYGAARRRPGLEFISAAKYTDKRCRMLKFQRSVTTTFVLELGDLYMRFYSNGVRVEVAGTPVEVATPYTESQLRDVQVSQINDEMRFVHPEHPNRILRRLSDTSFTFTEIEYTEPPLREENLDETKTISVSAISGTGITLTAVGHTFDADVVGGYYRVGHAREFSDTKLIILISNNNTGSDAIRVKGDWEIYTSGNWEGRIALQRRVSGGAWKNLRTWYGNNDRNITADGTELEDDVEYRLFLTEATPKGTNQADSNPTAVLEVVSSEEYGVAKITAVAGDGLTATADVKVNFSATTTSFLWSEGAWSTARGFPRSITLHQGRMVFGGNEAQAQTVWLSNIDGYDSFTAEDLQDSDSFNVTLGATEYNAIQWISTTSKNLLIGTTGGEWSLSSGDEANVLTIASARAVRESNLGSDHIQPPTANKAVLFVETGGRKLSEITYSFEQDGFINAELTELAEHITKGGLKEVAYQSQRDSILWGVTGEGNLVGLTYVRRQEVVGWHRHTTQGEFESVAVISSGEEEEEVWFSVKRTINGATVRYVERFYPNMWRLQEAAVIPDDLNYLDASQVITGVDMASGTVTHLDNETVHVLEDGAVTPPTRLEGATQTITFEQPTQKAVVGLPYTSVVEPMSLEVPTQQGSSQGREKRVHEMVASVFQTSVFNFGITGQDLDIFYPRSTEDAMDEAVPLTTEKHDLAMPSDWDNNTFVRLTQDQPLPLTVLGLVRNYRIEGNA